MNILIQRNGQLSGPYPPALARQYLAQGALLPQDLARDEGQPTAPWVTLAKLLAHLPPPPSAGNPFAQGVRTLKSFDRRLLLPWRELSSSKHLQDRRLLGLAGAGLAPLLAISITPGVWLGYWAIALYFSVLWALFFYFLFRTPQVAPRICYLCFFFTGIVSVTGLLMLHQIPPLNWLQALAESSHMLPRLVGMLFGVGLPEELCKAAILFYLVRRPGSLLVPQTVVFYGMMSGLGFGIYEGVQYQTHYNRELVIDVAYFANIARLTSLPFLHAIWTGMAGYFISFASLMPVKRYGLWAVAILIPGTLHGLYDTIGIDVLRVPIGALSVVLLMIYLANCQRMQQHLATP